MASFLVISWSSAPHTGHLVADMSMSSVTPRVLASCPSRASSVPPMIRTEWMFFPRARLCSSSSRVKRTESGTWELCMRLLSSAFGSYSVTYPSILSQRAKPPSIPSTTNLNLRAYFARRSPSLPWRLSLPPCRRAFRRRWWNGLHPVS